MADSSGIFGRFSPTRQAFTGLAVLVGIATSPLFAGGQVQPAMVPGAMAPGAPAVRPGPVVDPPILVRGYPVSAAEMPGVVAELQASYAGRKEIKIAADSRTRQVIVIAPADVQEAIAARLDGLRPVPAARPAPTPRPEASLTTVSYQLRNRTWEEFENRVQSVWGVRPAGTAVKVVYHPHGEIGHVAIQVDRQRGRIDVLAPESDAQAWLRVVQTIDAPPAANGDRTQLVGINRADPEVIGRTISLVRAAADPEGMQLAGKRHIGQFMTMVFQPNAEVAQPGPDQPQPNQPQPNPAQPGDADAEQPAGPGGELPGGVEGALGRIGNVQIEFVEGLDVVIIRGKQKDVERVQQIIEEIERQSELTKPEVEIYYLRHVDGNALSTLIAQVYDQVFSARQGRVSITPLTQPNALMLIGRKENLGPVKDLIEKLDRPMPADSQLKVFRLKFMSSVDAERTIRNFFVAQPGTGTDPRTALGTRVMVVADYRSNSLIVQASPRDLAELVKLIESLDVASSPAVNEVRVFKLRNAMADTLAPVIQEAITGQAAGQQGQGGGQQQFQQQGQGGATQAIATPRAIGLQMLRIDQQGKQLLESGILTGVRVTAEPAGNSLVVSGPAECMPLMEELIRQLDAMPASEAQIKVFTIVNGDATALSTMLGSLFGQATQGGGGGGGGGPNGFALQTASGASDSGLVPLRFSVDQRTNSIIATGSAADLDVVYRILVRLDEGDIRERVTTVYRLRNAPATDVANALNQLLTSQRQVNQLSPNLTSPFEQIEREVIVVPELVSNSLIVSATPRYYEEIKKVVLDLDRRPPMVIIQVLIAEVTLTENEEFGVELGLQDSLLFDRSSVTGTGTSTSLAPGYNFIGQPLGNSNSAASLATRSNLLGQSVTSFGTGVTNASLGFGGLVLSASNDSVNLLLRALQQNNRLQVISRPQVQTLDNQGAFVQIGQRVPRITSSQLTVNGTINNTVLENVGIILGVTPRTSPDGVIVMEVNAEKSELGPIDSGIPISISATGQVVRSPIINITTAQTTVSARSGQTVILGGLITKSSNENTRRVPYLGDIPVLGRLFRYDSFALIRRELLIILTPHIMNTDEAIEWMNIRESERMNWCLADIANIHGASSLSAGANRAVNPQTPIIFPDTDPTGQQGAPQGLPQGVTPQGPNAILPAPAPFVPQPTPALPPVPNLPSPLDPLLPPPGTPPGILPPAAIPQAGMQQQAMPPGMLAQRNPIQQNTAGQGLSPGGLRPPVIQPQMPAPVGMPAQRMPPQGALPPPAMPLQGVPQTSGLLPQQIVPAEPVARSHVPPFQGNIAPADYSQSQYPAAVGNVAPASYSPQAPNAAPNYQSYPSLR